MNKVQIIADSTIDITPEMYEKYNIRMIPLSVNFGEESFKDTVEISPDEIYERVEKGSPLPSTAAIPPAVFKEVLQEYIDKDMDIVFSGIGSKLSTTYQNFLLAASEFPEGRIYAVDSENLSTGTGLLVLKMCKLRDEGKSAKEIAEEVQKLTGKVSTKFVLNKLDYMKKGGRCSAIVALFGHLFHIHPILAMKEGKLLVSKKPRGPMKVAYNEMLDELKNDLPNVDLDHVMLTHSGMDQDGLNYLYDEMVKLVGKDCISITRAGCVVSSHCGPDTVGILYIKK